MYAPSHSAILMTHMDPHVQHPNFVYASHLCYHFVLFLSILPKLHLLLPCPSWCATSLFVGDLP